MRCPASPLSLRAGQGGRARAREARRARRQSGGPGARAGPRAGRHGSSPACRPRQRRPHPFVKTCRVSQCISPKTGATNPVVIPSTLPSWLPASVGWGLRAPSGMRPTRAALPGEGRGGRLRGQGEAPAQARRPLTLSAYHPVEGPQLGHVDEEAPARCAGVCVLRAARGIITWRLVARPAGPAAGRAAHLRKAACCTSSNVISPPCDDGEGGGCVAARRRQARLGGSAGEAGRARRAWS
jgi:hypothetical protein